MFATTVTPCPAPPTPEGEVPALAYSLTLPAAPRSAAVARLAARAVLEAHRLGAVADSVVLAVSELTACASRFAPEGQVHLSLRYRDGAVRIVSYDAHPRHPHPRLAAVCDARRRGALRVVARLVRAEGGSWGTGAADEPGGGTRMWVVLPCVAD